MIGELFNWPAFRRRLEAKEPTRDAVIEKAFVQYVKGNDSFEDKSTAEMSDFRLTFKAAWILSEMISNPPPAPEPWKPGPCKDCAGTGEIGLSDGDIVCPKCFGSGDPDKPGIFKMDLRK